MARDLSQFIQENLLYFQGYEKVILYYDNGQQRLFHSKRDLKKDFLKGIRKKEFT